MGGGEVGTSPVVGGPKVMDEKKIHEEQEADNANHGKDQQGQIEGHGGDQSAAPTRDPQINLPNVR